MMPRWFYVRRGDLGMWLLQVAANWCFVPNIDVQRSNDGQNMVIILSNLPIKTIMKDGEAIGSEVSLEGEEESETLQ